MIQKSVKCPECREDLVLSHTQEDGRKFYRCDNKDCSVFNLIDWRSGSIAYSGRYHLDKLPNEDSLSKM